MIYYHLVHCSPEKRKNTFSSLFEILGKEEGLGLDIHVYTHVETLGYNFKGRPHLIWDLR